MMEAQGAEELYLKLGRPQKINNKGEVFLKDYLNPLLSPQEICQKLSISLATFYNYEKELNLPQVRVAIGLSSANLPLKHALSANKTESDKSEIALISEIARLARIRVNLIPKDTITLEAHYAVKAKQVDFAISSITCTKERSAQFYFSNPYSPEVKPLGVLIKLKNSNHIKIKPRGKYILGVPAGTVHSEHALQNMSQDFEIKLVRSIPLTIKALTGYKIDFALLHPFFLEIAKEEAKSLQICSDPIFYNAFTGMMFHSESEFLRPLINRAIDRRLEDKFLAEKYL